MELQSALHPSEPLLRPDDIVLGLDEAGRGSWLGPLVIGGFLTDRATADTLPEMGVADSKCLTPRRREALFRQLAAVGRRLTIALPPATIDRWVRDGRLNDLEAHAFARLIRRTRPGFVYLDACDPVASRFGIRVASLSGVDARMDARHRADEEIPVVSAASIVAKVCRDRAVSRLSKELDGEIGSGYPSDPTTVTFVRDFFATPHAHPEWLRHSWAPTERLMRERSARRLENFE
ncbi:MAG: ribonuclease HII [Thermoplasmata archaeon]|nr:ribonuclease HII [Thermoplasmata archaeon]